MDLKYNSLTEEEKEELLAEHYTHNVSMKGSRGMGKGDVKNIYGGKSSLRHEDIKSLFTTSHQTEDHDDDASDISDKKQD